MYLYQLPRHQNIKIYIDNQVVIFDHLDGLYSYCWLEKDKTKIVNLIATLSLNKYKDGYKACKIKGEIDNE